MRVRFFLGKALSHRESYISLVRLHLPISYVYVDGIRKFVVQISSIYKILIGYWVAVKVRTTRSIVMHKNKFRMGGRILRRVLMIPCEQFLRYHLKNTRSVDMLEIIRGRVDGLGDAC